MNAHKHFHLHPTVLSMIIEIGRDYGLRAVRLPYETSAPALLKPWIALVRARLDRAGLAHNDYVVGIEHTGAMDEAVLLDALAKLPPGVGEIYCHPAECRRRPDHADDGRLPSGGRTRCVAVTARRGRAEGRGRRDRRLCRRVRPARRTWRAGVARTGAQPS